MTAIEWTAWTLLALCAVGYVAAYRYIMAGLRSDSPKMGRKRPAIESGPGSTRESTSARPGAG